MKKKFLALAALLVVLASSAEFFAQTRIKFARGRSSATVSGVIGPSGQRDYVLWARYGQYLTARVNSPGGCIKFTTLDYYQEYEAGNGDNWVQIMNVCRSRASFSLTVSIR